MKSSATIWSKSIVKLPKNIYNFCIRYLNNSLANATNLHKWGKIPSPMCLHSNNPKILGHVVAGCVTALNEKRYNYRHDSILLNIIRSIESIESITLYADIAGYKTPSLITGEEERPDILVLNNKNIYAIELTAGFETNVSKNSERKIARYRELTDRLAKSYTARFVDLSMGALGSYVWRIVQKLRENVKRPWYVQSRTGLLAMQDK